MGLVDDAEAFEEAAKERSFSGATKRDVQTWLFRLRTGFDGSYDLELKGTETDFEARLVHERGGDDDLFAEMYVDTGGGVEVGAFVLGDDEDEIYRFVEKRD